MAREYFCAYHSYLQSMKQLSDAEVGRLFRALLKYSKTGELDALYGNERFVADTIVAQIDRDKQKYAKKCAVNRENGVKGGLANAPERGANAPERPRTPPKEKEKEKEKEKKKEKNKENIISPNGDICAKQCDCSAPDDPKVIILPLNDGSDFPISESTIKEFSGLYPSVNVDQEIRKMRAWLLSNPKNRKTKSGIMRFVNAWLSKTQDQAHVQRQGTSGRTQQTHGFEVGEAERESIRKLMEE